MRYRPFGPHGVVASALSLRVSDGGLRAGPEAWTRLIYSALECGINCFEIDARHPAVIDGVSQALQAVERHLLVISWRVGRMPAGSQPVKDFSGGVIVNQVRAILARTGLEYLDVAMLDDPRASELPQDGVAALLQLKAGGAARMVGVSGDDDALGDYITTGKFDVLGAPYNLTSGWRERQWLRAAASRDMAVIGAKPYPADFHAQVAQAKTGKPRTALAHVGTYAFLDRTHGWTAEEICLAYALTEPSLATIQVGPECADRLEDLCKVTDRELPPGVSAQIEMARFMPLPEAGAKAAQAGRA